MRWHEEHVSTEMLDGRVLHEHVEQDQQINFRVKEHISQECGTPVMQPALPRIDV